jgi:molybdate transport system substrate-binding protein
MRCIFLVDRKRLPSRNAFWLRLPFALFFLGMVPVAAEPVRLMAAASLADALGALRPRMEDIAGGPVRLNLGASSVLARQIREGAPADLFVSADEAKMDDLARAGLIETASRRTLLSNTLAIVVAAEGGAAVAHPRDLAGPAVRRLALAETGTVPAGIYAREYLTRLGIWEAVRGKVVPTENVRAALAAVEAGNAQAGIVYRTDALASRRVRVAFAVPREDGPRILYPAAVLRGSREPEAARRLLAYLAGPEAAAVFAKYGFLPPP